MPHTRPAPTRSADQGSSGLNPKEPRRPPALLSSSHLDAALDSNLQSAGLSLLRRRIEPTSIARPGATKNVAGAALIDVPRSGLPARFANEFTLPLPSNFEWPRFAFCSLYEHSGEEREAHAHERHRPCCSVADRRCVLATSALTWHFIGRVQDFVTAYPYPLEDVATHTTCGWANWASWKTWEAKIRSGAMLQAAEELLWAMCLGNRSLAEQPPTAMQHIVGPPTQIVLGRHHGAPNKTYYWWLRNLSLVPPSLELADNELWNELTVGGDAEDRMLKRGYTPRNIAKACAWEHAHLVQKTAQNLNRPADVPCHEYFEWRAQMRGDYTLFKSHYAPRLAGAAWALEATDTPLLVLVPVAQSRAGPCFMVPLDTADTIFGCVRQMLQPAERQANLAAEFLVDSLDTVFAAYTPDDRKDATSSAWLSASPPRPNLARMGSKNDLQRDQRHDRS